MVTIGDVAKAAGVSASTVSYVLSGKRPISPETMARVRKSIDELSYRPHAGARALASRRTAIVGLAAPLRSGNNVPVVLQFVSAVAEGARRRAHDVLLVTQDEGVEGVRRVGQTALVDGFVLMDVPSDEPRAAILRDMGVPFVLIGYPDDRDGVTCIDFDFAAAARTCVGHLADLGHRTIGMLGAAPTEYERRISYAVRFVAGFEGAVADRGVDGHWRPVSTGFDAVGAAVRDLLTERPETTGLVVHNEGALGSVLHTLSRLGLRVPQDMSVVVVAPDAMAVDHGVRLTGVAIPAEEIGLVAVDLLLDHLEGDRPHETRLVSSPLTLRDSTAAPRTATSGALPARHPVPVDA